MILEPPIPSLRIGGLTVHLFDPHADQSMDVTFLDEGGGFYVSLKMEEAGEMRLDADELVALATWCKETCHALDVRGQEKTA